jgi:hypothetical protein
LVIFANLVFIIHTLDSRIQDTADEHFIEVSESLFTAFYLAELILKLVVHREFYFFNDEAAFNILDFFLVVMGIFQLILVVTGASDSVWDTGFLRVLRIFKVAKVFRMFRTLSLLAEVRLMMECVAQSMGSLVWAMMLLFFLSLLFGLFFEQALATAIGHDELNDQDSELLIDAFGTVWRSVFTLVKATTGGEDWMITYRLLLPLGSLADAVFVFYIVFMAIAVMNIVTSVFLDKAMRVAKPGIETMMLEKHRTDIEDARELTAMVSEMDTHHSGTITFTDFMCYMKEEKFRLYFEVRGLNIKDTSMFFHMLSSASKGLHKDAECEDYEENVDLRAFVTGCMRLKGVASCMDLYTLSWEVKQMRNEIHSLAR